MTGAAMPMLPAPGKMPTKKVDAPIIKIVIRNVYSNTWLCCMYIYSLDYVLLVKNGGVLIVQIPTAHFDHNYGPYPFVLGPNPQKVVDETSDVTVLIPTTLPSVGRKSAPTILKAGWRSAAMASCAVGTRTTLRWSKPTTPNRIRKKADCSSRATARVSYIYDAFALYRQLPNGVPGAYRLLANLVSLGKNPEWK